MKQKFPYKEKKSKNDNVFSFVQMRAAIKNTGSRSSFTHNYTSEDWKVLANWILFYVTRRKKALSSLYLSFYPTLNNNPEIDTQ